MASDLHWFSLPEPPLAFVRAPTMRAPMPNANPCRPPPPPLVCPLLAFGKLYFTYGFAFAYVVPERGGGTVGNGCGTFDGGGTECHAWDEKEEWRDDRE